MEKLLVIPHMWSLSVRVRSHEIARRLTGRFEVYYLHWTEAFGQGRGRLLRRAKQAWSELNQAAGRCCGFERPDGPVRYLTAPMILRGSGARIAWNRRGIARACRQRGIRRILNASAAYHATGGLPGIASVYDLVDDHASLAGPRSRPIVERIIAHEMAASQAVITISHALVDLIRRRYGRDATYVPNGVDIAEMRSVDPQQVRQVRRRLGLEGRYVIGCIGNHGSWSGLGLLTQAFAALRDRLPEASLLIVGPGEEAAKYRHLAGDRVLFTGQIPPAEVSKYFHAIDVGVLPFDLLPFTENALPIKVLEYGAARKWTLATPLKELRTLALPGVEFVPPRAEDWASALFSARGRAWRPEWDEAYRRFDWASVAQKVVDVFDQVEPVS